jgi:hypothetical protein
MVRKARLFLAMTRYTPSRLAKTGVNRIIALLIKS